MAPNLVVMDLVVAAPVAKEPAIDAPVVVEPVAKEPKPVTKEPVAEELVIKVLVVVAKTHVVGSASEAPSPPIGVPVQMLGSATTTLVLLVLSGFLG